MNHRIPLIIALVVITVAPIVHAEDRGKLIFEDDFSREDLPGNEEQKANGWGTNSQSRAKGNKQIWFRDGAMHIKTHAEADHAASITHPAEFRDGTLEMRFMLEDEKDVLGLNFADLSFKEVWAGHLFKVEFAANYVSITDLKTGSMDLKIRQARTEGKLTDEQKAMLATKAKKAPAKIETGKWHTLLVTIAGDTVTASVDGKQMVEFSSPGIAHPTKRLLRLAVPRAAVVDDLKIWAKSPAVDAK